MATPVRFPAGLSTFPRRSTLNTFPLATSPSLIAQIEDFMGYDVDDFTVTQTNGTVAAIGATGAVIKLSTSGGGATDKVMLARNTQAVQFIQGAQVWFSQRVAYPRTVGNTNDTNIYMGIFDNADPTAASNGIYFLKPTGGTFVNFIIKTAAGTTTFQHVADLARPSGLYGDLNSTNGTLTAVVAGNAFTGISVATAGAGYMVPPLCLATSTSGGTAGNIPVTCGLASTSYNVGNPIMPIYTTGLRYESLYSPVVAVPGSGYTNTTGATTYIEIEPWIDLQFYFDGKSTLAVGVNGRTVMTIGAAGQSSVAAGGTIDLATVGFNSFASTTQLSTAICPVQPVTGSVYNLVPLVPMGIAAGFANTSANARAFYLKEFALAVESR